MRLSVIGCGYLGAVHAASMARLGHDVVGIDIDTARISKLAAGEAPFFEPGFPELLRDALESGRLRFSTDAAAAAGRELHFIAVGTPEGADGAADLGFLYRAVDALVPHLRPGDVVVGKSTVPVGTAADLRARLAGSGAILVWNPEFLREGRAVEDSIAPDRLVYGVADGEEDGVARLDEVYRSLLERGTPRLVVDLATAELVKVAANAFLAAKISFINAMAEISDAVGADVVRLADAIGYDDRIGRAYLNAGIGFGGGCLPKDIRAFRARASELGASDVVTLLERIDRINLRQRERVVEIVTEMVGDLRGRRIAVLGLAFKPDSDDVRDSPGLAVATRLAESGAEVVATDPVANESARREHPEFSYQADPMAAAHDADMVVLVTDWMQYRSLDPEELGSAVRARRIVDARNCLDPERWRGAGWEYRGIGRR